MSRKQCIWSAQYRVVFFFFSSQIGYKLPTPQIQIVCGASKKNPTTDPIPQSTKFSHLAEKPFPWFHFFWIWQ